MRTQNLFHVTTRQKLKSLTPVERKLYKLIVAEHARVLRLSPDRYYRNLDFSEWRSRRQAIDDVQLGNGVRVVGTWLDVAPADRQCRRRALLALAAAVLVVLLTCEGGSVTHVRLIVDDETDAPESPLPCSE